MDTNKGKLICEFTHEATIAQQNGRKKLFFSFSPLSLARSSSSSHSFLYSTGSKALMILLLLFNWCHDVMVLVSLLCILNSHNDTQASPPACLPASSSVSFSSSPLFCAAQQLF
jgi:hypothetical protein